MPVRGTEVEESNLGLSWVLIELIDKPLGLRLLCVFTAAHHKDTKAQRRFSPLRVCRNFGLIVYSSRLCSFMVKIVNVQFLLDICLYEGNTNESSIAGHYSLF
jgi:hypothetical protein